MFFRGVLMRPTRGDGYLTTAESARLVGRKPVTIRQWRKRGYLVAQGLDERGYPLHSRQAVRAAERIAPSAKVSESTVPKRVDLPVLNPSVASNVAALPLPGSAPGCSDKPEVRMLVWAWNAQMGLMFANGGAQATSNSLMCNTGVNLRLLRQDDSGKMQEALVSFAT